MQPTKAAFLKEYRKKLAETYSWAHGKKLNDFMSSVSETLSGANTWTGSGAQAIDAWIAIGGKGRMTLAKLRALP